MQLNKKSDSRANQIKQHEKTFAIQFPEAYKKIQDGLKKLISIKTK